VKEKKVSSTGVLPRTHPNRVGGKKLCSSGIPSERGAGKHLAVKGAPDGAWGQESEENPIPLHCGEKQSNFSKGNTLKGTIGHTAKKEKKTEERSMGDGVQKRGL